MAINRDKVLDGAERLLARGKVEAAIQEYRKVLAETPKDIALLNKVGDLYVRINRNDDAVRLFLQLASGYSDDGFFVKAIAIYKKILKFDPTRMVVFERLADLYHKQGLVNEARVQYQVLVDYHQKHGDTRAATQSLEKMAELDPDDPTPRVRLSEIFHAAGNRERELSELRALAELMMRHQRYDEAGQIYARAVAAAPDDLAFVTDAVLGLKEAGQVAAAARLLSIAVEKNPQAERIARLAGLGGRPTPGGEMPAPAGTVRDTTATGLRVRDLTPPPPELEPAAPPPAPKMKPEPDFVVELPEEEGSPTEIRPTDEMLRRSPDSPWFEGGLAADPEFELEIELVDESAPPAPAPAAAAPPAPAEPEPAPKFEWEFAIEPELEVPEIIAPVAAAPPVPAAAEGVQSFELGLDLEELERTSYEIVPEPVPIARRLGDLLAEAEVFRKYGLREKAHDRVREILQHDATHLEALALSVNLFLEEGRSDRVLPRARQLAELAPGSEAAQDIWTPLRQKLERAKFRFEGGLPVAPPVAKKPKKDSVSALLEDLVSLTAEPRRPRPSPPPPRPAPPPAPPAAPARPEEALSWLDEAPPAPPPPPVTPPPTPAAKPAASASPPPAVPAAPRPELHEEKLFEDEEGFFDLAAELEEELSKEELLAASGPIGRDEPTLEEIVEGFKKGVAESLSSEDYDTHFNLGIAYREMGLLDEAIGEFQLAAKDPKYLIDCCSLLGGCFLEKGLPELAIKWYRKGLDVPDLPEEATLGLLYDIGNLYTVTGNAESARKTFVEVYGINSNYRDVVARLEELGSH